MGNIKKIISFLCMILILNFVFCLGFFFGVFGDGLGLYFGGDGIVRIWFFIYICKLIVFWIINVIVSVCCKLECIFDFIYICLCYKLIVDVIGLIVDLKVDFVFY